MLHHLRALGIRRLSPKLRATLKGGAEALRRYLASWVEHNPGIKIANSSMKEWVRLESGMEVKVYSKRIAVGGWAGEIELVAAAHSCAAEIWVWDARNGGFERTSRFESPTSTGQHIVHLLYTNGNHYDAFEPDTDELRSLLKGAEDTLSS